MKIRWNIVSLHMCRTHRIHASSHMIIMKSFCFLLDEGWKIYGCLVNPEYQLNVCLMCFIPQITGLSVILRCTLCLQGFTLAVPLRPWRIIVIKKHTYIWSGAPSGHNLFLINIWFSVKNKLPIDQTYTCLVSLESSLKMCENGVHAVQIYILNTFWII